MAPRDSFPQSRLASWRGVVGDRLNRAKRSSGTTTSPSRSLRPIQTVHFETGESRELRRPNETAFFVPVSPLLRESRLARARLATVCPVLAPTPPLLPSLHCGQFRTSLLILERRFVGIAEIHLLPLRSILACRDPAFAPHRPRPDVVPSEDYSHWPPGFADY